MKVLPINNYSSEKKYNKLMPTHAPLDPHTVDIVCKYGIDLTGQCLPKDISPLSLYGTGAIGRVIASIIAEREVESRLKERKIKNAAARARILAMQTSKLLEKYNINGKIKNFEKGTKKTLVIIFNKKDFCNYIDGETGKCISIPDACEKYMKQILSIYKKTYLSQVRTKSYYNKIYVTVKRH